MTVPWGMNSSAKMPIPWIALRAIRVLTRSMRALYPRPLDKHSLCVQRGGRLALGAPGCRIDAHPLEQGEQDEGAAEEDEENPEVVGEGEQLRLAGDLLVQVADGAAVGGEVVGALGGAV